MFATELRQQDMMLPWTRGLEGQHSLMLVGSVAHFVVYRKPGEVAGQMPLAGAVNSCWGSVKQLTVIHLGRQIVERK